MKKLFTIIICCYNNKKYIADCLKSIIEQRNYKFNYEIIFVDDNSNDGSLKIAKSFLKNNKNYKILKNKKNIGLSKSCNKALKKTKTKYFIRLDSDDLVSKNFISSFENRVQKNQDFIFCDRIEFNKKNKKKINNKNKNIFKMISCGVALKTKKVLKLGGYRQILWEEYDLYLRYLSKKKHIVRIKKYLYFYRKHKFSMSYKKNWVKKAWEELILKYGKKKLLEYGDFNTL